MDETGRPKFASVEKTDAGTTVMLFYFEPMKCWHISAKMSEKAEKKNRNLGNCWVYVKSDVQHPVEIKEQWWHEGQGTLGNALSAILFGVFDPWIPD